MFRPVAFAAARAASLRIAPRSIAPSRFQVRASVQSFTPAFQNLRCYSSGGGLLAEDEIKGRIMDLLKNFDKVKDISKLSASSEFAKDLGLDSLDTVEVVMAIEEEFGIEIPDKEADAIHSVAQAIGYIKAQPDAQ